MSLLLFFNQAATGDATVLPPPATATASAPAPNILYDYAIAVPQATATASAPAPTIAISVSPPQAIATASCPVPTVSASGPAVLTLVYPLRTLLGTSATHTETTVKATRTAVPKLGTYSK